MLADGTLTPKGFGQPGDFRRECNAEIVMFPMGSSKERDNNRAHIGNYLGQIVTFVLENTPI